MPAFTDSDALTFLEGVTVAAAELAAYGAALTDTAAVGPEGTETATLGESGVLGVTVTQAESIALNGIGALPTPNGMDTGTLSEGVTIAVAELSAYGATLSDTSAQFSGTESTDTDTGTLGDAALVTATLMAGDNVTQNSPDGSLEESNPPTDAITLIDTTMELIVDDLVAEGTLSDTAVVAVVTSDTDSATQASSVSLSSTGSPNVLVDDDDTMTLAEAVVLTVLAVASDTGAAAEGQPVFLIMPSGDIVALTDAQASMLVLTATETGTLGESATLSVSGAPIVVTLTSSDALTLSESHKLVAPLFLGKALGTVAIVQRLDATPGIAKRVAVTENALDALLVGAGDL